MKGSSTAAALFVAASGLAGYAVAVTPEAEGLRVLAAEDAYVKAEVSRDPEALGRLVDERFVLNNADGTTSDKAALIEGVLGMNMVGQAISERSVLVEGDIALVFGTAELHFAAEEPDEPPSKSTLRYTSTYVKRNGEWRMLALHMSPRKER